MGMWASNSATCTHVCMGTAKGQLCCAHRGSLGSWLGLDKRINLLDMDEPALCQPHHPRALRVPWVLLQLNLLHRGGFELEILHQSSTRTPFARTRVLMVWRWHG